MYSENDILHVHLNSSLYISIWNRFLITLYLSFTSKKCSLCSLACWVVVVFFFFLHFSQKILNYFNIAFVDEFSYQLTS